MLVFGGCFVTFSILASVLSKIVGALMTHDMILRALIQK